jgi:hypothetical protein
MGRRGVSACQSGGLSRWRRAACCRPSCKGFRNLADAEQGQALIIVLILVFIMMLFSTVLVVASSNRSSLTLQDALRSEARAAAQYGLATFLSWSNIQSGWVTMCANMAGGGLNSSFCNSVDQVPGSQKEYWLVKVPPNQAAGCSPSSLLKNPNGCVYTVTAYGWAGDYDGNKSTPGSPVFKGPSARYLIRLTMQLPLGTFLRYIYFTRYEVGDPASTTYSSYYGSSGGFPPYPDDYALAQKNCAYDYWEKNPTTGGNGPNYRGNWSDAKGQTLGPCVEIQFGGGDVINGPLFTDDNPLTCVATFNGTVYSGDPTRGSYTGGTVYRTNSCGGGGPTFRGSPPTAWATFTPTPPTLDTPKSAAVLEGCFYTGPTFIQLEPNFQMKVWSPFTLAFPPGFYAASCGSPGYQIVKNGSSYVLKQTGGCLASAAGCTVNIDPRLSGVHFDGAVYVQNVPNNPSDPNYWPAPLIQQVINSTCSQPVSYNSATGSFSPAYCASPYISGEGQAPVSVSSNGNATYPPLYQTSSGAPAGFATMGDVFVRGDPGFSAPACQNTGAGVAKQNVSGAFDGYLTIAAANNIVVVGNLVYNNPNPLLDCSNLSNGIQASNGGGNPPEALGLVAGNYVEINHPDNDPNNRFDPWPTLVNPVIEGAILADNHSFIVNRYSAGGGDGRLNIAGSIIQNFRGVVGIVGGAGYVKNYMWDVALFVNPPPFFPVPKPIPLGYAG